MMKVESPNVRHFLASIENSKLPVDLSALLRDEAVACGWVSGFAVFESLELLVTSESGRVERVQMKGPIAGQLEGIVGMGDRDVTVSLRGVFSKRGALGVETVSGVVHSATARHGEMHIVALDDANGSLAVDPSTGFDTLRLSASGTTKGTSTQRAAASDASTYASARRVDDSRPSAAGSQPQMSPGGSAAGLPLKPVARATHEEEEEDDGPMPEAGDLAEHFAFGRCEVLKTDGDRLHVRLEKDQRIKEISTNMLKVTRLDDVGGKRIFKLARKL